MSSYPPLLTIGKLSMGWDSVFGSQIEQSIGFAQQVATAVSLSNVTSCYNFVDFPKTVCLIIYKAYLYTKLQRQ